MTATDGLLPWLLAHLAAEEATARSPRSYDRPHGPDCAISADNAPACDCRYAERVLRQVAAMRRRLERHRLESDPASLSLHGPLCAWCSVPQAGAYQAWPCPDVRDDLSVFADRPGFDPWWAPEEDAGDG